MIWAVWRARTTLRGRGNDFTVTFEPIDNDRNLRVTRRIYDEDLWQPVTVQSFYRKFSNEARWDIYPSNRGTPSNANAADRDNVRTPAGETIRVDNEGTVEDNDSQTDKTVQRGAIGGALIGAIAGGGKGAAIGAAIGAGGGAGTVIAEGRDQLDLQRGTEVTITSSAARGQRE